MSQDSTVKRSLDDFKRWKVPELKDVLWNRGLKTSGTKEELTALAFGAEQCSMPLKMTAKQRRSQKGGQGVWPHLTKFWAPLRKFALARKL